MAKLKAGLIGLGVMGKNHARVLATLEDVEFVGVVDADDKKLTDFKFGPVFKSVEELIAKKVDYCFVAVPTQFHEEISKNLAEAGIHAFIEKPLAHNLESANNILNYFNQAKLIAAVGHIERYNPALQEARKRIKADELGKIYQISTRRQGPFPSRIADVGVVKDLATHDIDITFWLTGKNYLSIAARTAHRAGRVHEDLVSVVATLEGGIIITHIVNWLSPFKERRIVISGEKGALVADTLTADLTFYSNGTFSNDWNEVANFRGVSEGNVIRYAIPKLEPLRVEHEKFRDAVLGKSFDIVTLQEGLNAVEVAESILQSANLGKTIEFNREII